MHKERSSVEGTMITVQQRSTERKNEVVPRHTEAERCAQEGNEGKQRRQRKQEADDDAPEDLVAGLEQD
jgi:hypothetical protein